MSKSSTVTLLVQCQGFLRAMARRRSYAALRRREAPSDLVQATNCEAVRDMDKFKGSTVEEFRAWLAEIMRTTVSDKIKHVKRKRRDPDKEVYIDAVADGAPAACECSLAHNDPSPASAVVAAEDEDRLLAAIRRLPDDQRDSVYLFYFQKLSRAATAAKLGVTEAAVAGLLARAREALGGLMGPRE